MRSRTSPNAFTRSNSVAVSPGSSSSLTNALIWGLLQTFSSISRFCCSISAAFLNRSCSSRRSTSSCRGSSGASPSAASAGSRGSSILLLMWISVAEFVYMAATLIHIKSKMLLPRDPALAAEGEAPEDPRQELVDRLLEHERFKNAAEMLQQKRLIEENVWSNPQIKAFVSEDDDPGLTATLFDLVKAFGEVLERIKNRPVYEVEAADITVGDMIRYLRDQFQQSKPDQPVFIMRIFEQQRSRRAMIALFLAVLEMVRMQAVVVAQKDLFGEIALQRHGRFDDVFASEQPMAAIEKDYN